MLAYIIYALLGLAVLLVVIGFFLPSRVTVERAITIDAPAEKIFPWAADLKLWPQWTVWCASAPGATPKTLPLQPSSGRP